MGASKYLEGIIVTSSGTITGQVYSKVGGTLLTTSGELTFTQFGDNPRNFRSTVMTDPATGTAKLILSRNGGDFAEWDIAFNPTVDMAGVYEFQNSPSMNEIASAFSEITVESNIVINPAQFQGGVNPGVIGIYRGDSQNYTLPLMGSVSTRAKLVLTAKPAWLAEQPGNTDSQATFQVQEGTGLTVLNGGTPPYPSDASLTVNNATTGQVVLSYNGRFAQSIGSQDLVWDAQWIDTSGGIHTPVGGTVSIVLDVTNAVS